MLTKSIVITLIVTEQLLDYEAARIIAFDLAIAFYKGLFFFLGLLIRLVAHLTSI